jgi:hypothetical protein
MTNINPKPMKNPITTSVCTRAPGSSFTPIRSYFVTASSHALALVNAASLPADVEIKAGWDACVSSIMRPAAQENLKKLFKHGFHKPGDAENRLGYYVGQLGLEDT